MSIKRANVMLQLSAITLVPELSPRVSSAVERYAPHEHPIVITGPIGAGKTHLAQLIHQRSARRGGFVAVPLTSLQQGFEHATLAGHDKGAYTGAHRGRAGLLAEAHEGTLLLDEIGDASVEGQRLLLELLTERGLRRLGEERRIRYDLRFILASHVDLDRATAEGKFREDLLSRLGNCWIHLPPLRERPEEIPALIEHHLGRLAADRGGSAPRLSAALMDTLVAAPWLYNVRSLVSECAALATARPASGVLDVGDLSERFWVEVRRYLGALSCPQARTDRALAVTGGRRADAARLLDLTERSLYRQLEGKPEYRTGRTRVRKDRPAT